MRAGTHSRSRNDGNDEVRKRESVPGRGNDSGKGVEGRRTPARAGIALLELSKPEVCTELSFVCCL